MLIIRYSATLHLRSNSMRACMRACVRACVVTPCVRACMHACVRACVRACVHAYVRACVRSNSARVCVLLLLLLLLLHLLTCVCARVRVFLRYKAFLHCDFCDARRFYATFLRGKAFLHGVFALQGVFTLCFCDVARFTQRCLHYVVFCTAYFVLR